MTLSDIVEAIRAFPGITRKHTIHEIVRVLPTTSFANVAASEGEDAAAIEFGDDYILFAADGIMESLLKTNPFYAGYFAVLVNVNGSCQVADKCLEYGTEMMVMISTDKAVNPTNIMGCSKRLAEIYVQSLGTAIVQGHVQGKTRFVTTRFGNVLGSNGSVIPRFREQIASGGPVTVTHPDITRFFMTIPEACRLVMEAATMSTGNQIFVFDMGQPVKIYDMAKKMIQLSGQTNVEIKEIGLRPGEKLYEELLATKENTKPTDNPKIMRAQVRDYEAEEVNAMLEELDKALSSCQDFPIVTQMKRIVPEFISNNSVFCQLDQH